MPKRKREPEKTEETSSTLSPVAERRSGRSRKATAPQEAPGSSRWNGVNYQNKKWNAEIYVNGNLHQIGSFDDEMEAAMAYDKSAISLLGIKHAILNFPKKHLPPTPQPPPLTTKKRERGRDRKKEVVEVVSKRDKVKEKAKEKAKEKGREKQEKEKEKEKDKEQEKDKEENLIHKNESDTETDEDEVPICSECKNDPDVMECPACGCMVCRKNDNKHLLLLCENKDCKGEYHTYCLIPPLSEVPSEEFFCPVHNIVVGTVVEAQVKSEDDSWITCIVTDVKMEERSFIYTMTCKSSGQVHIVDASKVKKKSTKKGKSNKSNSKDEKETVSIRIPENNSFTSNLPASPASSNKRNPPSVSSRSKRASSIDSNGQGLLKVTPRIRTPKVMKSEELQSDSYTVEDAVRVVREIRRNVPLTAQQLSILDNVIQGRSLEHIETVKLALVQQYRFLVMHF